jgi:glutamate racemase
MTTTTSNAPIGVFDSGIGGLSILKALRAEMPHERFVYFADSAHNPYGPKGDAFVIERSRTITAQLINDHGIKALVVACNTATAAAIHVLRAEHPSLPIVGVERIAVLATQGTLQSAKFQALLASQQSHAEFICTPCHGLADMIERSAEINNTTDLIAACALFIRTSGLFGTETGQIDTLVLGCTHYPLIKPYFRQAVGQQVHIIDNGQAVAKRTVQLLGLEATTLVTADHSTAEGNAANLAAAEQTGFQGASTSALQLLCSANPAHLQRAAQQWL